MAARMVGAEIIVHAHDLIYPGAVVGALQRIFSRQSDMGIGVSRAVLEVLEKGYHVHPLRNRVVHNGIPLEHIYQVEPAAKARVRAELAIPDGHDVIAMIARMHPIKGHASMLRIMARCVAARPQLTLILAGDGPERSACEAQVVALGLEQNVKFLGIRNDVPALLAAADVVVVPSQSEGLSLVAIEAGAAGRPVVCFDTGGLKDVVTDDVNGYLIPPGDEPAFAAALLELFNNPETRSRFGSNARVGVEHFSLQNHVMNLLACYRDVLASPSATAPASLKAGG
jgi:glycosyltransferase involved in cell wall biosynthesis